MPRYDAGDVAWAPQTKLTCLEAFMVKTLGFWCPRPLLFMVFGAHGFLICSLEVERLSIKCFFRKDYCFRNG